MKFTYFDECSLFGLADFERAQVRVAAAKEEREVERSMFLRDPHIGDTLRAYEALGFAYPEARELLLCGIPRDLVAEYAGKVPDRHSGAVSLFINAWRGRMPFSSVGLIKLVANWQETRRRQVQAEQMTPTRLGQIIMGLAMTVPGSIAGRRHV